MAVKNLIPPMAPIVATLSVLWQFLSVDHVPMPAATERLPFEVEAAASAEGLPDLVPTERVQDVATIENRPLFAPGRHPPEAIRAPAPVQDVPDEGPVMPPPIPVETTALEVPSPPMVHLVGRMLVGQSLRALIRSDGDGTEIWVSIGDDVMGWKLVEITQSRIRLTRDNSEISIQLFD